MSTQNNRVDEYINHFEGITKQRLQELRAIVKPLLPDAKEGVSYGVAAYSRNGYIVYFGGYEKFVSIYPVHNVSELFGVELKPYLSGKATARFLHSKPLPKALIVKLVQMLDEYNKQRNKK